MTSFADIGAAVIGTGFIGTVHVEALRRIGIDVRGVLGSTPERGTDRAQTLGVARAYASLEELLGDRTVDVVHVTSPNHLHVGQASAVMAAGKHVVCEKPLAMNATESAELAARARGAPCRRRAGGAAGRLSGAARPGPGRARAPGGGGGGCGGAACGAATSPPRPGGAPRHPTSALPPQKQDGSTHVGPPITS